MYQVRERRKQRLGAKWVAGQLAELMKKIEQLEERNFRGWLPMMELVLPVWEEAAKYLKVETLVVDFGPGSRIGPVEYRQIAEFQASRHSAKDYEYRHYGYQIRINFQFSEI